MDGLKKAYYRTYQQVFDIGMRCLHWRKPIVISGAGCIRQVPDVLSKSGVTKVMVVTGSHVVKSLGPKLFAALEDAGMPYEVFSEVEANPSVNTVEKIRAQYTETGCSGFVALGGGSPMDATKGAAARVACPKKSCDDMAGVMRVGKTVPPIVAIPTTSGTGSETTIAAVITDSETHHKYALMDLKLMPLYAILDPELTVGLPPRTTATTGMDALTHAIEAYISWTYNTKESLRLAEEAVKLIFDNLELAYQHGEDLKVRENMMIAAFKAGFAFSRAGVGNVHAIAHTLGGLYNTPHGLANAVILPIVLEDYGEAVYPKLARLCEIAGVKADGTVVLFQADGTMAPRSVGYTAEEEARMMVALGCVAAIQLDEGGSSTYLSQREGESDLTMRNTPAGGSERVVSGTILVVSTVAASGEFDHAAVTPDGEYYTPNSTVELTASAMDFSGAPAKALRLHGQRCGHGHCERDHCQWQRRFRRVHFVRQDRRRDDRPNQRRQDGRFDHPACAGAGRPFVRVE